jgi:hypothetical protein
MLAGKERLLVKTTRVIRGYWRPACGSPEGTVGAGRANAYVYQIIAGELFDSLLVGAICFVGLILTGCRILS